MSLNHQKDLGPSPTTFEGGPAKRISYADQLRRTLMSCLLWNDTFYESGEDVASRIRSLTSKVTPDEAFLLAMDARSKGNIRHAPLLVLAALASLGKVRKEWVQVIIQRPDEMGELLSIMWEKGKTPIPNQVKKGLAACFNKFDDYQIKKWKESGHVISLRDVMFMVHPRPGEKLPTTGKVTQVTRDYGDGHVGHPYRHADSVLTRLASGTLEPADTLEASLTSGGRLSDSDKKKAYTDLLISKKLGAMAILKNLRNMNLCGVDDDLIKQAIMEANYTRILPYRFITAAAAAPRMEPTLEKAMLSSLATFKKLSGKTLILVDVSGSMRDPLSPPTSPTWKKGSNIDVMTRMDAAFGVAIMARELFENVRIFSFSDHFVEVPARRGFALRDAIRISQRHSGTYMGEAVTEANQIGYNRLIIFTDEQSADKVPDPLRGSFGYINNVASYQNGVGYGPWTHIDGFSSQLLNYIASLESGDFGIWNSDSEL